MWIIETILAALAIAAAGLMFNLNSRESINSRMFFFYLYTTGAFALGTYLLYTGTFKWNSKVVFSGVLIGLGLAAGNSVFLRALRAGPISLTSPLINLNVAFLVVAAWFIYDESLGFLQLLCVVSMIAALLLLSFDPNEKLRIKEYKWFFLVAAASALFAIRNGGLKVTQEVGLDNSSVIFFAYLTPAIVFFIMKPSNSVKENLALRFGLIGGFFSVVGMVLYASALSKGPASLVIPVFSTYNVFLVIGGHILFSERLSLIQYLSVFATILATVGLKLTEV